jgi:hypothetical protein
MLRITYAFSLYGTCDVGLRIDTYARQGEKIGRGSADIIFGVLTEAMREAGLEQARRQRELGS